MEYKQTPQYIKAIAGRSVTGIFAVHGCVDDGGDRSHLGAFAKTFAGDLKRAKFLWMHDAWSPPTAVIKSLREVSREELPAEVLAAAPDATGGAEVTREYLTTERGDEILTGLVAGAINQMSYGYDPVRFDFENPSDGKQVRNLREVRLWDVSDVNWGMNSATVASKFSVPPLPYAEQAEWVLAACKALTERSESLADLRRKEGRVLSDANRKRLGSLLESLRAVEADIDDLLSSTEPAPEKSADVMRLFLEFQSIQTRLHGVAI